MAEETPWAGVLRAMQGFPAPWHVAGGWAIDLFLGRQRRAHKDWDVSIARADQFALQSHFGAERLRKVVDHQLLPWPEGERLELPIFQVFALNDQGEPELEFLLEDDQDGN
jgi:hypothetical protein